MKTITTLLVLFTFMNINYAQNASDKDLVKKACMNYLEGFYEGDTTKLIASLKPSLYKIGFWKNKDSGKYKFSNQMTYEEAKNYAKEVLEKKSFPKSNAPKKVEVLDVMNHIAAAKVTAWWGTDYILLSKNGEKWMIEEVIWEGPLQIN